MREVRVVRAGGGGRVAERVRVAERWWQRLRGLLGRGPLERDEGMLLLDCPSVHGFGMRYSIDVAFLDRTGRVVRTTRLDPWALALGGPESAHALELPPGRLRESGVGHGDVLTWS